MSFCGFFSLFCVMTFVVQRQGKMLNEVTQEHWQDMGKLLFGRDRFTPTSASANTLIWYANIPEETTWYLARVAGLGHRGCGSWSWSLLWRFVLLLTKHTKRCKPVMTAIAVWMLLAHAVDVYLLIMPTVPRRWPMRRTGQTSQQEPVRIY